VLRVTSRATDGSELGKQSLRGPRRIEQRLTVARWTTGSYTCVMKVISQREFRNNSAAVMDAVEAGETYHVTRNGVPVAELRPLARRRRLTAEELVERHKKLPRVEYAQLRNDADQVFGTEGRVDDDDPWDRIGG
jgi:prevent-host-death family protein